MKYTFRRTQTTYSEFVVEAEDSKTAEDFINGDLEYYDNGEIDWEILSEDVDVWLDKGEIMNTIIWLPKATNNAIIDDVKTMGGYIANEEFSSAKSADKACLQLNDETNGNQGIYYVV